MPHSPHPDARRRILAAARDCIATCPPPAGRGHIPLSPVQWATCVADAGLVDLPADSRRQLDAFTRTLDWDKVGDVRRSAQELADHFTRTARALAALSWLAPSAALSPADLHDRLRQACLAILDGVVDDGPPVADEFPGEKGWQQRLDASASLTVADVWADALEAPWDAVASPEGRYSASRLLARFHGNYDELSARLNRLMSWLGPSDLELLKGARMVAYLLNSPRPYLTVLISIEVFTLLLERFERDPLSTARALRELALRMDRSHSSQRGVIRDQRALREVDSDSERAFLHLDLYRRAVEGQLRPVAWMLLRVKNGVGADRTPELGQLRARLESDGGTIARTAAELLNVAARNGAAHEDYRWDRGRRALVVANDEISVADLKIDFQKIYGFVCGAELAWAKARATSPRLRDLQDVGQISEPDVLRLDRVLALFGTNGISLSEARLEASRFEASVEELTEGALNPAIQALMWVSAEFPEVQELRLYVSPLDEPVIALSPRSLSHCLRLWFQARPDEESMPVSTFLPAHAENRGRVESPGDTTTAMLWFALTESVEHLQQVASDLQASPASRSAETIALLCKRLLRVAASLEACAELQHRGDPDDEARYVPANGLLRAAAHWLGIEQQSGQRGLSGQIVQEIVAQLDGLPEVQLVPRLPPSALAGTLPTE